MSAHESVELSVVARQAGVRVTVVRRYLEFGLFEEHHESEQRAPAEAVSEPRYDPLSAARVARAERLRQDFELNYAGAVLVSELLDRIRELEARKS